jgi:hypothetical protein
VTPVAVSPDAGPALRPVSFAQGFAFCLPAIVIAASSIVLRQTGGLSQFVALLTLLPFILFKTRRAVGFGKWQALFLFNAVLLVILSSVDALPRPWGYPRDGGLVLRQSYTILLMPVVIYACTVYFRALVEKRLLGSVTKIFGVAVLVEYVVFLNARQALGIGASDLSILYGLPNNTLMFAVSLVALRHIEGPLRYRYLWYGFLLLNVLSTGMQNLLVAMTSVLIALVKKPRMIFSGLFAALLLTTIVSYFAFDLAYALDVNTAARAVWAVDGLKQWITNAPFGFGFGVPALQGLVYSGGRSFEMARDLFTGEVGYYLIGHHNSFVGVFFRVGIIGGIAFLGMLAPVLPRSDAPQERAFGMIASMLLIALYLNVAVESPTYVFGICYAIGVALGLRSLRQAARHG